MNIIEAAEAAMAGKQVELCSNEVLWVGDCLKWKLTNEVVAITKFILYNANDWRIIPDPPKLYPFSEAFERMKQGHWMKSVVSDRVIAFTYGYWMKRTFDSDHCKIIEPTFSVPEIEGQWQEMQEVYS